MKNKEWGITIHIHATVWKVLKILITQGELEWRNGTRPHQCDLGSLPDPPSNEDFPPSTNTNTSKFQLIRSHIRLLYKEP